MSELQVWDRREQKMIREEVYGGSLMKLLYQPRLPRPLKDLWVNLFADHLLSKSLPSKVIGVWEDSKFSKKLIPGFIERFRIPMEEFEEVDYPNFNGFFTRKFQPEARRFPSEATTLGAPAEGRYLVYSNIHSTLTLPIKGAEIRLPELLGPLFREELLGGSLFLARLCPVDYHRYHFPCDAQVLETHRAHGPLQSVHPRALEVRGDILFRNERQITLLKSPTFGLMAYIEVGALGVGKMVDTYFNPHSKEPGQVQVKKGQEKGMFLFGGSTVILIIQRPLQKHIGPAQDLLERTQSKIETLVRLGEPIYEA
jgi:phosphatidylserine decarboxylase